MLEENDDLVKSLNSYEKKDILPIILPKISKRDVWLMEGDKKIKPVLIPSFLVETTGKRPCSLLVEGINGHVVKNHDAKQTIPMPRMRFSESQQAVFKVIAALRRFNMVKLKAKLSEDDIRQRLSFLPIGSIKNCYIVYYKTE